MYYLLFVRIQINMLESYCWNSICHFRSLSDFLFWIEFTYTATQFLQAISADRSLQAMLKLGTLDLANEINFNTPNNLQYSFRVKL